MTIMVDWVWWEGVIAGLGWGLVIGGVLGVRWLEQRIVTEHDEAGGDR